MKVDSPPQPCSRCHRQVVLAGYSWGRQWVHLGTWRPQCGPPSWALARSAETASTAAS